MGSCEREPVCEEGGAGDAHKLEIISCKKIRKEMATQK